MVLYHNLLEAQVSVLVHYIGVTYVFGPGQGSLECILFYGRAWMRSKGWRICSR